MFLLSSRPAAAGGLRFAHVILSYNTGLLAVDSMVDSVHISRIPQGKDKPVIMKALVELDGPRSQPFQAFAEQREKWMLHDMYRAPGERS